MTLISCHGGRFKRANIPIFQFIIRDLLAIFESTIVIESLFSTSSRMVSLDYMDDYF